MSLLYFFFRFVKSERHTVSSWRRTLLSVIGFSFSVLHHSTPSVGELCVVLGAINGASLLERSCKMSRLTNIIVQKFGKEWR